MNDLPARILVTGGAGQLGRALARVAPRYAVDVECLSREGLDICNLLQVNEAIKAYRPSLILNAAAYTDVAGAEREPAEAFRVNAYGPALLAEAARRNGLGLIQVSTDFVFSGQGPHEEDAPTDPVNVYGASKLAGELAVLSSCPAAAVVRTAWVFDATSSNFVTRLLDQAGSRELDMVSDEMGSPTSATDIAEALLTLARYMLGGGHMPERIFHAVNAGEASRMDMAKAIFEHRQRQGHKSPKLVPVPAASLINSVRRPSDSRLSTARLSRLTGWQPRDWRLALEDVLDNIPAKGGSEYL